MLTTFFRLMGVVGVSLAAMLPVYGANLQALDLKVTGGAELSPAFAPAVRN